MSLHLKEFCVPYFSKEMADLKKIEVSVTYRDQPSRLFLTWVGMGGNWLFLLCFCHKSFMSLCWRLITEAYVKIEGRRVSSVRCCGLRCFKSLCHG